MLQPNSHFTIILAHLLQSGYIDKLLLVLATSCSWPAAFTALYVKDEPSQATGALLTVVWAVFFGSVGLAIQFYGPVDGMVLIALGVLAGQVVCRKKLKLKLAVPASALSFLMLVGLKY